MSTLFNKRSAIAYELVKELLANKYPIRGVGIVNGRTIAVYADEGNITAIRNSMTQLLYLLGHLTDKSETLSEIAQVRSTNCSDYRTASRVYPKIPRNLGELSEDNVTICYTCGVAWLVNRAASTQLIGALSEHRFAEQIQERVINVSNAI